MRVGVYLRVSVCVCVCVCVRAYARDAIARSPVCSYTDARRREVSAPRSVRL